MVIDSDYCPLYNSLNLSTLDFTKKESIVPDREELEQAITVLEGQRPVLGNDVVELSLASLRQKLVSLSPPPQVAQYQRVTVLVADLSGYTAMSEMMDAEEVRDTVNAIWDNLDGVIKAWGGRIDKHTGDGLIALFGLPTEHPDDQERAIMAALDMQTELALFNQQPMRLHGARPPSHAKLHMRIGVDIGPVVFGRVGMDGQETAMGDAVRLATQLQQLAPIGGILISYDMYSQVHAHFEVEPLAPVALDGKTSRIGVYVVKGESGASGTNWSFNGRALSAGRLVGRHTELERLQYALQTTIEGSVAQFIIMTGEPGVGKSCLIDEFEQLLRLSPVRLRPLRGVATRETTHSPYALWRDLFRNHLGIHTRSSGAVAMERFVQGVASTLAKGANGAPDSAHQMGRLLGFDLNRMRGVPGANGDWPRALDNAHQDIVRYFRSLSATSPATILILDDMQWADEKSMDLLDHLFHSCQDLPLMFLCSGRPPLFDRRPSWRSMETVHDSAYLAFELAPLSPIDSRHLISELLRGSAQLPLKIVDLIIEKTGGNPSYIEELTRMLVDSGVVFKDGNQWRAQFSNLQGRKQLPSLTNLLQARLDQLSSIEQAVVKAAAVLGRIFWKSAVLSLLRSNGIAVSDGETEEALRSLERQTLLYHHRMPAFAGVHEYVFRHNRFRNLAYESLLPEELAHYHRQAAAWLIDRGEARSSEYAGIIASHFEKGALPAQAAKWYGRAGSRAKKTRAAETALQQYRRAVNLLPAGVEFAIERIEFLEALANLSRLRARYSEAIQAYEEMRQAAVEVGDGAAELRALLGMYRTQDYQGDYDLARRSSQTAVDLARELDSPHLLVSALVARAWSLSRMEKMDAALAMAREALALSTKSNAPTEVALSNALIGNLCRLQHWYDKARRSTEKALSQYRQLGDREWEALTLASLGQLAFARYDYPSAVIHYCDSLGIATDLGDLYGTIRCLRRLGQLSRLQNEVEQADHHYREAFMLAERSQNARYCATIALDLGALHISQAAADFHMATDIDRDLHAQKAQMWLTRAIRFGSESHVQLTVALAKVEMARFLLLEGRRDEALSQAKETVASLAKGFPAHSARSSYESLGTAWRTLGLVASELPELELPVNVFKQPLDAASCFGKSLRAFAKLRQGGKADRAITLYLWARVELNKGDRKKGTLLWQRAEALFKKTGMEMHANRMKRSPTQ
jgi:class 3 adenylate cyclase/tetratricopeptide (TPR) repeat protein